SSPIEPTGYRLKATHHLGLALGAATLALLLVACGSTATTSTGTPTPVPTPKDAQAIEKVDFTQLPAIQTLLQQLASGSVDSKGVFYADLTGDKRDEAIVPITSGGTMGNIAYVVLAMKSGKPQVILTRTMDRTTPSGLKMTIEKGTLIETAALYADEDPLCCPSQLRRTEFQWDGSQMQVAGEARIQQTPSAKQ
ncbi:MAG TPA: hypothetical protein VFY10_02420, partial [Dehalococcoidia bacterium]|nr:hypothetical protein [Dehalococcoidia bacterium]